MGVNPDSFRGRQSISNPQRLPGNDENTKTRTLLPRGANKEFGAAAPKCKAEQRKQHAQQTVTLRKFKASKALFEESCKNYFVEQSSTESPQKK